MRRAVIIFALILFGVTMAACGQGSKQVEYTIEMTEFAYSPDRIEARVGDEVTIKLVNHGALDHELMIGDEVMEEDGIPVGFKHDMFEGVEPVVHKEHMDEHSEGEHTEESDEHMEDQHTEEASEHEEGGEHMHEGFMVSLTGNTSEEATITFTVTEEMVGEWEIACFLDSGAHYSSGMKGVMVVSP